MNRLGEILTYCRNAPVKTGVMMSCGDFEHIAIALQAARSLLSEESVREAASGYVMLQVFDEACEKLEGVK